MFGSALNLMTLSNALVAELPSTAEALPGVGIEVRNDLHGSLFDGLSASAAGQAAQDAILKIPALAEECAFDNYAEPKKAETQSLAILAVNCQFAELEGCQISEHSDWEGYWQCSTHRLKLPRLPGGSLLGLDPSPGFPDLEKSAVHLVAEATTFQHVVSDQS